jgi:hypothetical protein
MVVQGGPAGFWKTRYGKKLWKDITDAEKYLKEVIPLLWITSTRVSSMPRARICSRNKWTLLWKIL